MCTSSVSGLHADGSVQPDDLAVNHGVLGQWCHHVGKLSGVSQAWGEGHLAGEERAHLLWKTSQEGSGKQTWRKKEEDQMLMSRHIYRRRKACLSVHTHRELLWWLWCPWAPDLVLWGGSFQRCHLWKLNTLLGRPGEKKTERRTADKQSDQWVVSFVCLVLCLYQTTCPSNAATLAVLMMQPLCPSASGSFFPIAPTARRITLKVPAMFTCRKHTKRSQT